LTQLFPAFAHQWAKEREPEWKRSTQRKVADILNGHLISHFRGRAVGDITKQDILNLRTHLAKDYRDGQGLSPARINGILNILRQILEEAADRFQFTMPYRGIKALRVPRTEVEPLSIGEVRQFLAAVPPQYQVLYTVAFFTGLRTSELLGLKWEHVDFPHAQIHIRETWVYGAEDTPKTDRSQRSVSLHSVVLTALQQHRAEHKDNPSPFVFPNAAGKPLSHHNLANRIWNPTLKSLGLKPRRPYQTRHTAATLWLSSGESPEWIASQLGHASTKMLFTVYSQYVPNATRQDGSAFERLLQQSAIVAPVTNLSPAANDATATTSKKESANG
jgi:integrase